MLLTLLLGVGAAFLLDSLDATIKSSADVEEKLKRPLLGMVPLLKDEALRAVSMLHKNDEAQRSRSAFRGSHAHDPDSHLAR